MKFDYRCLLLALLLVFWALRFPSEPQARTQVDDFCGPGRHLCARHPGQLCRCADHDLCSVSNQPATAASAPGQPRLEADLVGAPVLRLNLGRPCDTALSLVWRPGLAPAYAPEPPPPRQVAAT